MVVIIDVDYNEQTMCGHAAGVIANSLLDQKEIGVVTAVVPDIEGYVPGQFYKRELKCIDAILRQTEIQDMELIVVDGYADFGTAQKALGTRVYEKYGIPVIGVAKNRYKANADPDIEILRGGSQKKLYVTSRGIRNEEAKRCIENMYGPYRIPYLLKLADACARDWSR